MDKSFEKQNGWRRNNKYEYSYTLKEIVCESNNFFTKTAPDKDDFTSEFFQTFKKGITSMLHKVFQKIEKDMTAQVTFEVCVTLIVKLTSLCKKNH